MLVDVNASFARSSGGIAADLPNDARARAAEKIGITMHIVPRAHDAIEQRRAASIRICAEIDPLSFSGPEAEFDEGAMRRAIAGAAGTPGVVAIELGWPHTVFGSVKRGALVEACAAQRVPLRTDDRAAITPLAAAHPDTSFVLSALGDDPYWETTLESVAALANVAVDISGARTERGMLDRALAVLGPERLLWGTGSQMETGLAQLRALDVIAPGADVIEAIRWKNAFRVFPRLADPA